LDDVEVRLSHERIHAADCRECEQDDGKLERILMRLNIHGSLTPEQRARLLEIAGRCPVHRTLR
jgi:uncharacterized OsmC-like protein